MPKNYKPTIAHYFQRLLVEKGHVHKIYTQNIDALEIVAKIPDEKLINAHGSFKKGHCLSCNKEYSLEWMKSISFYIINF
jgi:NAD-dependent SIR2 family protein deacetylase